MIHKFVFLLFLLGGTLGQYVTSPTPSHLELPRHDSVDHIENIEVDSTQVVITTTKQGPPENLKIHIELVDIEANKKVNPVDLSGLWLTITRGRYTIPFLRPDTWYGVRFRSENEINGRKIVHEDEKLIKTKPREDYGGIPNLATLPPPIGVMGFPPPVNGAGTHPNAHLENNNNHNSFQEGQHEHAVNSESYNHNHVEHGSGESHGQGLGLGSSQTPQPGHVSSNKEHQGQWGNHEAENGQASHSGHELGSALGSAISNEFGLNTHPSHGSNTHSSQNNHGDLNHNQNHNSQDGNNFLDVKIHRSLDGVENYESVYVTVSWRSHEGRTNLTTGIVKLRVLCNTTETKEDISLKGDEDAITIEITMDQKYDIEEMDSDKHQIKAHITPLKCHQICWTSDLVLSSEFGDFKKHLSDECKGIEGTTSTTYLRDLKKVSVVENSLSINELVVETEVAESEYGTVTIIVQKLGDNETLPERKTFDTTTSNGKFVVPLEDDAIYAVKYEYVKTKPFHYTSKTQFLVESPAPNSTRPTNALVDLSVVPQTFDYKHDKPDSALKPEPPYILISRSPNYQNHNLLVDIDPFCHENRTRFNLEDRYPQHQVDAVPFLCGLEPKMYFCDHNTTYKACDSTLCFSTSVLIGTDLFTAETRCLNATQQFPALVSASSLFNCFSVFLVLSLLLYPF